MQPCIQNDASLALASEGSDHELATSFVTIAGQTSPEPLEGKILEACVQQGKQYLLFLTDDIPHEDSLHIHLLDNDLNRMDTATLGALYTTGNFRNLTCENSGSITFEFFGDGVWEVSVLPNSRLRLPLISGPRGVSWSNGWFHVLEIRKRPAHKAP